MKWGHPFLRTQTNNISAFVIWDAPRLSCCLYMQKVSVTKELWLEFTQVCFRLFYLPINSYKVLINERNLNYQLVTIWKSLTHGCWEQQSPQKTSHAGHKPRISKNMPRGQWGDPSVWNRASERIQLCAHMMKSLKSKPKESKHYSIYN